MGKYSQGRKMPFRKRAGKGSVNFCVICDRNYLLMLIKYLCTSLKTLEVHKLLCIST